MKEPREIVLNDPNSVYSYLLELWDQIEQAKGIIKKFIQWNYGCCDIPDYKEIVKQAEQFLSSSEKTNN